MKPDCDFFAEAGRDDGGRCDAPSPPFGRNPSYGGCNKCPHNRNRGKWQPVAETVQVHVPTDEERAAAQENRDVITRGLWREIHTLAAAGELDDAKLDVIVKRLPCGTCGPDFAAIRASEPIPPDAAGQFALTVGWHNAVNAKLGKPLVTVEEARSANLNGRWSSAVGINNKMP